MPLDTEDPVARLKRFGSPYRDERGEPVRLAPNFPGPLYQSRIDRSVSCAHTVFDPTSSELEQNRNLEEMRGGIVRCARDNGASIVIYQQQPDGEFRETFYRQLMLYGSDHTPAKLEEFKGLYPDETLVLGPTYTWAVIAARQGNGWQDLNAPRRIEGKFLVYKVEVRDNVPPHFASGEQGGDLIKDYVVVAQG